MDHLPLYVASTPDKQWRKHPYTYLNNQGWEDEMVNVIKRKITELIVVDFQWHIAISVEYLHHTGRKN